MKLTNSQINWLNNVVKGTWQLNEHGLVDVNGHVECISQQLIKFPVQFGIVSGKFNCYDNMMIYLNGAPREVGGNFFCFINNLTSLYGSPEKVGGNFDCSYNNLTSLTNSPKEVGGDFDCSYNKLTSLFGAPKEIIGRFDCACTKLTSLFGTPEKVGGDFNCVGNHTLTDLSDIFQKVGGNLYPGEGKFDCTDEFALWWVIKSEKALERINNPSDKIVQLHNMLWEI